MPHGQESGPCLPRDVLSAGHPAGAPARDRTATSHPSTDLQGRPQPQGSPPHPGSVCSQFTWAAHTAKFNLLSLRAQKRSKNKTGLCCFHFESIVSDTELQKNSPGTVQTTEKLPFAVNYLNSIDYPTLVPI